MRCSHCVSTCRRSMTSGWMQPNEERSMRGRWLLRGLGFGVLAVAFVAVFSFVVMLLWNALVPGLFHGPMLGFWQAAGLLVLSRILFGGFRRRGWHGGWRHRWRERW